MSMKNDIIEAEFRTKGGSIVQRDLSKISKEIAILTEKNKDLKLAKASLEAEDKKYIAGTKKLTAEYKSVSSEISKNNELLTIQKGRLKVTSSQLNISEMSVSQLKNKQRELNKELADPILKVLPDRHKRLSNELEEVNRNLGRVNEGTKRTHSVMSGLKMLLPTLGFAAVIASIKKWGEGMLGLDEQLSDVMKTTGLTKMGVRELYDELGKLNTRTSRKELLLLAEEAGRLGKKSKADIMDFVEVANQITVALGDDLGDSATAVKEVGKLTNIYKVGAQYGTEFKDSMLKIGSGINEVSANSSAQADYLIGYLKRMGGVASQANINASSILGYASALDQLGQTQEMAATAQGKVMIDMFKDSAKYAEIAKMSTEDFAKLLETDANEAFMKLLEGLNGNSEGMTVMASKLDGLGVDGTRAVQVLSALASNTDMVRKEQSLANKAMNEGISLTNEYATKNESFAGSIAKIGNFIQTQFIQSSFLNWLEKVAGKMAEWTKVDVSETLKEQRKHVNLLTIEMTSANTSAKRRNEIYAELKDIAPDVVKGIDAENISISTLRENLEKYNMATIKKLALQDSEIELNDEREKAGKATNERMERELELQEELYSIQLQVQNKIGKWKGNENIAKQIQEINLSSDDVIEKQKKVYELLGDQRNFITTNAKGLISGIVSSREEEKKATDDVTKSLEAYMDRYKALFGEQKEVDVSNNISAFIKQPNESQIKQVKDYFYSVGNDAYEEVLRAFDQAAEKSPLNLKPVSEEEEVDIDPESNYEIQQYMQTLEYKASLLQFQRDNDLIGEKEYQDKIDVLNKQHEEKRYKQNMEYSQKAKQMAQFGTNFVSALMDLELEAAGDNEEKKKQIRKKYATMQFMASASGIIVNTASAIMQALAQLGPIAGGIAAGIVGATGAVQLGIAYKEMEKVKGLEDGGRFKVRRAQDNKEFRAKYDPNRRGFVDKPTVLVGENGNEFVANAKAVENPTLRPFFDVIDAAQRSGTIETLNLPAVAQQLAVEGRESGGYTKAETTPSYSESSNNNSLTDLIQQSNATNQELNAILKKGVRAIVIYGDIEDKMEEVETIKNAVNM